MKRKLMVPTIVVAGVLIGMITIFPSAMADHKDDNDDDDNNSNDWKTCKKSFYKAFRDFRKHGSVSPEMITLVKQCLADGFESPWKLPKDELDDAPPPVLSGLSVEFVTMEAEVPNGSSIIEKKLYPCPTGKIIIDEPHLELNANAQLSVEIMTDRTTLMMSSFNLNSPGNVVLVTPCLGVTGN